MSARALPSIRIDGVSKWYGEVMGLNEVTADFGPGVSGLLGPNGAGKSTLLKLACGMLKPSLGRVTVCDVTPFNRTSVMRRIGICPEQDAAYPHVSIVEVLTYLTRLHGFTKAEARARATRSLERVGLSDAMNRSAVGFSKGMRQRAKIAQAIAHEPDVLILDEPLNGLDPPGRREMSHLIEELGAQGCCVLVSSHILHEVQQLAPRVLLLNTGRLLAEGSVRQIRAELPEHPLTIRVKTQDPAAVAAHVLRTDGIRRLEWQPDGLEVTTARPDELLDRIAAAADEDGVAIQAVEPVDDDLEAVFRYLIR